MNIVGKQNFNYKHRLIILSLLFIFFNFPIFFQQVPWNTLPQYTFVPNWLFYPLIFSFAIAFIDIIIWFVIMIFLEVLGIVAMVYAFSFTGLYSFSWVSLENPILQSSMSISLLIIDVVWYFDLYPPIHALLTRTYWTSPEDRARKKYEKKFKSKEEEPGNETAEREPVMIHTKEELARLLNLWQQKYAQATTEEGRKLANEKIREYQTELEKLKAKSGTTPEERAKLTQGGDNE
ncbi:MULTISPECIES: hypothetical protein [Thermoplasmatales]|uniref:Multipass membrane protein n=1 Tax=Cuniculiplasma divulgatum TaxID=1673428 RepID=A0A1N5SDG0_9ARCH|nr:MULTISPECIES: hypothetical protein [Thermoplasmatales]EQB72206.1 MAG: hypothetical protein AMDU1_APLC00012G0011 [Thermoplasmatales archaeon A-plasma]WMT53364.1 MAG: hypothetical protein RE473_00605 [Ferroplasma acidiphilum]SIM34105.1 multipass membrane protein [Cuniculiplasma divulgatum]SJK84538.1 multipass membrane protein [Cuniculiplasma divulgatum]